MVPREPTSIASLLWFGLIAGYVEAVGFLDLAGLYPGIMSGNTVQLGVSMTQGSLDKLSLISTALALFFCGALIGSALFARFKHPRYSLLIIAAVVAGACLLKWFNPDAKRWELGLLAVAMAMQGQAMARVAHTQVQTIVVTSNLLKFADLLVRKISNADSGVTGTNSPPSTRDVIAPGIAWLSFSIGAAAGAIATNTFTLPLVAPVVALMIMAATARVDGRSGTA